MKDQKRLAVLSDLSCFGRCSLTVALPVISARGLEAAAIPSALLSTHTGGFQKPFCRPLSGELKEMLAHWKREGIAADGLLTGYLCSPEQAGTAAEIARSLLQNGGQLIVDPVLGDHGKLYAGLSAQMPDAMRSLCREARVITPNVTEALLLLEKDSAAPPETREQAEQLARALAKETGTAVCLTGVCFGESAIGVAVLERNAVRWIWQEKLNASAHGTGDLFSAVLAAEIVSGSSLFKAAGRAADFAARCLRNTPDSQEKRFGVRFEECLSALIPKREESV